MGGLDLLHGSTDPTLPWDTPDLDSLQTILALKLIEKKSLSLLFEYQTAKYILDGK